jgi:hypothetical protein
VIRALRRWRDARRLRTVAVGPVCAVCGSLAGTGPDGWVYLAISVEQQRAERVCSDGCMTFWLDPDWQASTGRDPWILVPLPGVSDLT